LDYLNGRREALKGEKNNRHEVVHFGEVKKI
jgi:hypothetical protein